MIKSIKLLFVSVDRTVSVKLNFECLLPNNKSDGEHWHFDCLNGEVREYAYFTVGGYHVKVLISTFICRRIIKNIVSIMRNIRR